MKDLLVLHTEHCIIKPLAYECMQELHDGSSWIMWIWGRW